MSGDRLEVNVTFDERGYIGSAPELRSSVMALSLGGLRRIHHSADQPVSNHPLPWASTPAARQLVARFGEIPPFCDGDHRRGVGSV